MTAPGTLCRIKGPVFMSTEPAHSIAASAITVPSLSFIAGEVVTFVRRVKDRKEGHYWIEVVARNGVWYVRPHQIEQVSP